MVCHSRAANFTLGLQTAQINKLHDYDGATENQLEVLERLGLFKVNSALVAQSPQDLPAEIRSIPQRRTPQDSALLPTSTHNLPRLANPYDQSSNLADRARAYLHSNCSSCHVPAGGGNATLDLRHNIPLAQTGLIDENPKHQRFDINDARLVASGNPERSILLKRMSIRGNGQMPQLATQVIDEEAVALIRQWISSLSKQ
jgi:mono/diheme cytochrome c family protein